MARQTDTPRVSIQSNKVSVNINNVDIIKDASWGVRNGERVGLVGPNGSGKSTLLRIIAKESKPSSGEVIYAPSSLRIAYLKQESIDGLQLSRKLGEELLSVFARETSLLRRISELEGSQVHSGDSRYSELMELQETAQDCGAYKIVDEANRVRAMLGFTEQDVDLLVSSFSGGWKMRIGLGKLLLEKPHVLLLDEPTNHLDLDSVEWVEKFLQASEIPMVIVSHDREFMNRVCTRIVDIEAGRTISYRGSYIDFEKSRRIRRDTWKRTYEKQQKIIHHQEREIRIAKSNPASTEVLKQKSRALQRFLSSDAVVPPPPTSLIYSNFRFPALPSSTGPLIAVEGLTHGYTDDASNSTDLGVVLFHDASLVLHRHERAVLLGENGSGKSTLLRLLVNKETPYKGKAQITGKKTTYNYFEQNQTEQQDPQMTVLEALRSAEPEEGLSEKELRNLLARFRFRNEAVHRPVRVLSGGEKARLALCRLLLVPTNLLILDEPTNHLDIVSKEVLEEALQEYTGCVLLVTHDRYFASQVANTVITLKNGKLAKYSTDYKTFMDERDDLKRKVQSRYLTGAAPISHAPQQILRAVDALTSQESDKLAKRRKSFGGKGPSGKTKIKNAKRWTNL